MTTFSIAESLQFGWDTFKKRPGFFIAAVFVMFVIYGILSAVSPQESEPQTVFSVLVSIAAAVLGVFVEMMLVNLALKSHDAPESVSFSDATARLPFWKYLLAKALMGIIIVVGLILLIVPGIVAILMFLFTTYLVIDKNLGPIEAVKESRRITAGHRWQLLGLVLVVAVINIAGALLLGLGLFVSVPVSLLAFVHVYRTLEHKANEMAPAA